MRCKGCDYPLWNLTARQCPECGRPFQPSEFQFIANSVRFCCPHCKQDYYGTGPDGHLVPSAFDCVRCGKHLQMDGMVLLPTEGVQEDQTRVDHVPWLERRKIGRLKGWFGTIWRSMFEPGRLARATPADSSVGQAWWFGFLSNSFFQLVSLGGMALLFGVGFAFAAGGRAGTVMMASSLAGLLLLWILVTAIALPIWGLLAHLLLRLTGPTRLGPGASVRALCYASGAHAMAAIPCVGLYLLAVAWIWSGISAAAMLRVAHGVSWSRALVSALTPPACVLAALVALWIVLIVGIVPRAQFSVAAARQSAQQSTMVRVNLGLRSYRDRHSGQFPAHALEMIHDGDLLGSDLTPIRPGVVPGQGEPLLNTYAVRSTKDQDATVQRIVAGMAPGTIAHRLGDFVFTYHGLDPSTADPRLWVAIDYPLQPGPNPAPTIAVGTAGGAIEMIPRVSFPAKLAEQNLLRAPLPPLPDPATITTETPATGG